MTEPATDRALVRRFLRRGDEGAFDLLYERHTPRMYGLALRLAGGEESEAHEVVQEAWCRAFAGLSRFAGRSRFSSWLCGICVNVWRERNRRLVHEVELHTGDHAVDPPRHEETLELRRALDRMPPGYRAVLVLHGMYGYKHGEVAHMLRIAEGTSKSQYLRGRRALEKMLREPNDEEAE